MGPSSADSALVGLASPEGPRGSAAHVAIAVLKTFLSITTTDSVEIISGGLAKSPSEVLNPSTSLPKDAGGGPRVVVAMRLTATS